MSMFQSYKFTVAERFIRYAKIDTQSDPDSKTFPSTAKQNVLGELLKQELQSMDIDAHLDQYGYVYATIPANTSKHVPVICYCAHMDTAPDCSGTGVVPILHERYDGSDIILPDDPSQVITTNDHPYLLEKKGDDIITASGTTLLGADDKAGIAVIMDFAAYIKLHPELPHGTIKLFFTPDEEIGRGVDHVDIEKLGAEFGYTLDAGELGTVEAETFSADAVTITFNGVSAHPGYAKNKLVNALKVASAFIRMLPSDEWSPETTDDRYGFVHPVQFHGIAEKAVVEMIVRDFLTSRLNAYENSLRDKLEDVLKKFPGATAELTVREQYRNMKEILDLHPNVAAFAEEAVLRSGISVKQSSARGGTDGSRLSFMGLPCPNLFTGEMAFHGKHEFVSVQDMQKSVQMLVHLAMIWEEKS